MNNVPDYSHEYKVRNGTTFLLITDLNQGGMSVTNGIEKVVEEIQQVDGGLSDKKVVILYSDSEGNWDGWDNKTASFFSVGEKSANEAMDTYLLKQRNK